jgi:mRNA guanylyltransferase
MQQNVSFIISCALLLSNQNYRLKWKPPQENSIDLQIHLVPCNNPASGDQRPIIELWVWQTGTTHTFYATLGLTDEEWQKYRNQLNKGCIVEVVYDPQHVPPHKWKMLRFRNDKTTANHISVVEKIMKSIEDGIEEDKVSVQLQVSGLNGPALMVMN